MGLNVCPVGRGDCGKGMREGAGGVGLGQDVIQLFYIKSYQIRKADQRQGQWRDFHSLTFILICMCVAQSGTELKLNLKCVVIRKYAKAESIKSWH